MILEPSGNMIIKDGNRTMWETVSANLPYAKPPYQLILNAIGNLMILDSDRMIVWTSRVAFESNNRSFKAYLSDQGKLFVRYSENNIIWDSWPTSGNSSGTSFFTKFKFNFPRCLGDLNDNRYSLSNTKGNDKTMSNQTLISDDKKWTFKIKDRKNLVLSSQSKELTILAIPSNNNVIESIHLKSNGELVALNDANEEIWST